MLLPLVPLIFLSTFKYSQSRYCVLNLVTREDAWDKILHRDKMKFYVPSQPPRNQSCVNVKVRFQLKSFAFDEYEGKFTAKFWGLLNWSDERLTWSPESYGGVKKIVMRNTNIWVPSLTLINSIRPDYFIIEYGDCLVSNDGGILCVPELIYDSFCSAKLSYWPYDVQNCTLKFGNGNMFEATKFQFQTKLAMSLSPAEYSNGWNIVYMTSKEDSNSDVQLSISFILERQAYGLVIVLVCPCTIMCILTLASILLNVSDYIRLGLSSFSLASHFIFLLAIEEFLPKHGSDTPVVLFFVRGSIILTVTSVLVTYILSKIVSRETVPFEWVYSVSSKVSGSFARYLVFPRWYVNSDSNDLNVKNKDVWAYFANIINTVYLVIVISVYIGMFIAYMPKQPPKEY